MRRTLLFAAFVLAACAAGAARADDTLVTMGASGLQFVRAEGIAMHRVELLLSPQEARIRYEMRNDRGAPFAGRVAFPMPVLEGDPMFSP